MIDSSYVHRRRSWTNLIYHHCRRNIESHVRSRVSVNVRKTRYVRGRIHVSWGLRFLLNGVRLDVRAATPRVYQRARSILVPLLQYPKNDKQTHQTNMTPVRAHIADTTVWTSSFQNSRALFQIWADVDAVRNAFCLLDEGEIEVRMAVLVLLLWVRAQNLRYPINSVVVVSVGDAPVLALQIANMERPLTYRFQLLPVVTKVGGHRDRAELFLFIFFGNIENVTSLKSGADIIRKLVTSYRRGRRWPWSAAQSPE